MKATEHCTAEGCQREGVSSIEGNALCRTHFIDVCYTRLERYDELRKAQKLGVTDAESMRRFINECSRQADEIEQQAQDLDNLERAKLVDIILSASELGRHLRRSPRKAAAIPVHLCCDRLGGAWEEDSKTVLLSRYGASVQCSHPAKPGECIEVVRFDTGQKAHARVAWQRPGERDTVRIGVEFVDCDNFWGLDWAAIEETR
ncbi:MAG: PilZ domain-containing protein [Acidobacteriia bacterium]|nr:PilZ domain-containing protein [Terriglobia bacterium]